MAAAMQTQLRPVDPTIWRACAGNYVHVPAVGSMAYYFPQGHAQAQHCSSSLTQSQPLILCRVMGVDYLADEDTDEILAKIQLFPILNQQNKSTRTESAELTQSEFTSVVKVLTPSDANNGGGFSVPKSCADLVFPSLDFMADPPVQTLRVKDVLGEVWEFRHIFRGTPRRHLLTTGWSKFVNAKKLVAGDSVVFMRSQKSGQNFIGIRRAVKEKNVASNSRWNYLEVKDDEDKSGENAVVVKQAMDKALRGVGFEIVYYPKADVCDFVVQADMVESSILGVDWMVGTRVRMAMETEDLSRMTWIQGSVSKINQAASKNSPWKMLQVTWDDPDVVQNIKNVNPWQVECFSLPEHSEVPAAKKCRISVDAGSPLHGDGELIRGKGKISEDVGLLSCGDAEVFPVTGSSSSAVEHFTAHLNPLLTNSSSYPVGMQGARQDQICVSGVSNFIHENTHQTGSTFSVINTSPIAEAISTEVDTGNTQLNSLSADPPKDDQLFGNEVPGTQVCTASPKVGLSSFQLFGIEVAGTQVCTASSPKVGMSSFQLFGNEVADTQVCTASSPKVGISSFQLFGNEVAETQVFTASSPKVGISSFQLFGTEVAGTQVCTASSPKVGLSSFQLFGNEVAGTPVCTASSPKVGISSFQLFGTEVAGTQVCTAASPKVGISSFQLFGTEVAGTQVCTASSPEVGISSFQLFGNEVAGTQVCTASPKVGVSSFQLFGKIINM